MRHPTGTRARPEAASDSGDGAMVGQVAAGPSAAIEEGEREVVVRLALGWVVHGSVRVSCTPQTLVVEAERCARPGDAVAAGARREGTALRCVVPLPAVVKAGSARARFARGELTVHLALAGARPS